MSTSPVHNVAEFVIRNSVNLKTQQRITLLEDTAEILPHGTDAAEIIRIIATLREADRACRQFSFMDHSDQI